MRAHRWRGEVRHRHGARRAQRESRPHHALGSQERGGDGAHPAFAAGRSGGRLPGDGEHAGQDGARHRRRSGDHAAARHRQAGDGRPRDERADVAARGHAPQRPDPARGRRRCDGAVRGRDGLRRVRPRPPARSRGDLGADRGAFRYRGSWRGPGCGGRRHRTGRTGRDADRPQGTGSAAPARRRRGGRGGVCRSAADRGAGAAAGSVGAAAVEEGQGPRRAAHRSRGDQSPRLAPRRRHRAAAVR
jgi:hypothetical protein